eukprot:TRINITY_DN29235_c0_g1_i1.p1 TRINITY_DN29235_c0_g1~~TRINITY_DN29235_c0_g1_i1.p1  ORF type:complete len:1474 (-),score=263.58 TRINITY_DN29235_c0_g1_i1:144-4565(-)
MLGGARCPCVCSSCIIAVLLTNLLSCTVVAVHVQQSDEQAPGQTLSPADVNEAGKSALVTRGKNTGSEDANSALGDKSHENSGEDATQFSTGKASISIEYQEDGKPIVKVTHGSLSTASLARESTLGREDPLGVPKTLIDVLSVVVIVSVCLTALIFGLNMTVLPTIVFQLISASSIMYYAWSHGVISLSKLEVNKGYLAWSGLGLPSDPMDLGDTSWNSFIVNLKELLFLACLHLTGQTVLHRVKEASEMTQLKEAVLHCVWGLVCTLGMLGLTFGVGPLWMPLAWSLVNFTAAYFVPMPCSASATIGSGGRPFPADANSQADGATVSDEGVDDIGANPAAGWSLLVPWFLNISIFAVFGEHLYGLYGLGTFFFLLRTISFCADTLELRAGGTRAGLRLTDIPFSLALARFLDYLFYPPLYVIGPIIPYAEFVRARMSPMGPTDSAASSVFTRPSLAQVCKNVFGLVAIFWLFALLRHVVWPTAVAKHLLDFQPDSASFLLVFGLAYWFVFFAWFRFLICWRFFRIWAEADGIPAPENVRICVGSVAGVRAFWKSWHVSFYRWLQRYVYLPLGGSRVVWAPVNVFVVFGFVYFLHAPKQDQNAFSHHGVVFGFFAVGVDGIRDTVRIFMLINPDLNAHVQFAAYVIFAYTMVWAARQRDVPVKGEACESTGASNTSGDGAPNAGPSVSSGSSSSTHVATKPPVAPAPPPGPSILPSSAPLLTGLPPAAPPNTQSLASSPGGSSSSPSQRPPSPLSMVVKTKHLAPPLSSGDLEASPFWKAWRRARVVPVGILCFLVLGVQAVCLNTSEWHWERFEPYMTPIHAPVDSANKLLQAIPQALPSYRACEKLRMDAFSRARANAGSSMWVILLPAYTLWWIPKDLPWIQCGLVGKEGAEHAWNFVRVLYMAMFVLPVVLTMSSFLYHSSITDQALDFDISCVLANYSTLLSLHLALLILPPATSTVDRAYVTPRDFRPLSAIAALLPVFYVTVLLNIWHSVFPKLIVFLAFAHPLLMLCVAKTRTEKSPRSRNLLLAASFCAIVGFLAKVLDDSQEWLREGFMCQPDSFFQLTALTHMLFGIAGMLQFMAQRELLFRGLGLYEDDCVRSLYPRVEAGLRVLSRLDHGNSVHDVRKMVLGNGAPPSSIACVTEAELLSTWQCLAVWHVHGLVTKYQGHGDERLRSIPLHGCELPRGLPPPVISCQKGLKGSNDSMPNQDNFSLTRFRNGYCVACVFDGHGVAGHHVSARTVQTVPYFLSKNQFFPDDMARALTEAFESAERDLVLTAKSGGWDITSSGSTAVAAVWKGNKIWTANSGDSRCVIGNVSDKSIVFETHDHKPNSPQERQRIEAEGGEVRTQTYADGWVNHRIFVRGKDYPGLCMGRSFGDLSVKKHGVIVTPEVSAIQVDLEKQPFLLLSTDGVWEFLTTAHVVGTVANRIPALGAEKSVQELHADARERWKQEGSYCDDITTLLIRLR